MARWEATVRMFRPPHARDRTLVSSPSVLPARGGAGAGGRVRGPVSPTDERLVLRGHPLPDPASPADLIIVVLAKVAADFTRDPGFFVLPRRAMGRLLEWFSYL